MKLISTLIACTMALAITTRSVASDIIKLDRHNAKERTTKLEVTPQGIILDFGSPISSTVISHKSNIVFMGVDGVLCGAKASCGEQNPPTILFIRKIPKIDFKDEEGMSGGTSMLYVDTESGMYRFEFTPISKTPQYTKVEIQQEPTYSIVSE